MARGRGSCVPIDLERQHRQAEEVVHDIVPGKAAHRPAVLARHHARSGAVDRKPCCVARRELGCHALDLQKGVDRSRPNRSRSTGKRPVKGWARMPAQQTTVSAAMRSPVVSVASASSIAAMQTPGRISTPSAASASSMTVRASSPISQPIHCCRSARMTRGRARASAPNALCI